MCLSHSSLTPNGPQSSCQPQTLYREIMSAITKATRAIDGATAPQVKSGMTATAQPRRRIDRAAERRFYLWMTVAIVVTVLIGFSRSFFLRPLFPNLSSPREPFYLVHGTVFTLWFVTLIAQVALIRAGRVRLHRALGMCGAVLAVAVVALGVAGSLIAAKRPTGFFDVPIPAPQFLIVPLTEMLNFAAFVGFAVALRRNVQAHKRLMMLASIIMLNAAFARWPGVVGAGSIAYFLLNDLFLIPLVIWDRRSLGHVHPATWWGGGWFLLSQPLRLLLSGTSAWLAVAHWLL